MGGDKSGYMLVCTVYILVGMTVFTTIIEIVRRQYVSTHLHISTNFYMSTNIYVYLHISTHIYAYLHVYMSTHIYAYLHRYAESWRKMQELRAQIQAQLKLADHLRKLGEAGGE